MKRLLSILMVLAVCALPALATSTYWTLNVDNQPVPAELPPIPVGQNTLLVSARALCQALHANYDYDPASGQVRVSRSGTVVEMNENIPEARVNGRTVRMPVAARKESGAMMLPVPFVAEIFGCRSDVNAQTMTLSLTSGGSAAPSASVSAQAGPSAVSAQAGPVTLTAQTGGFVSPADATAAQKAVPSALPWLATGALPPAPGFPQSATSIPQMPTVTVQSPTLGASVPTIGAQQSVTIAANPGMQLPAIGSQPVPVVPAGSGQLPTVDGTRRSSGYTLPASSGVQLPNGAYEANMRVGPDERRLPMGAPENPWVDNSVNTAGKMDFIPSSESDVVGEPFDPNNPRPDPAITGLTVERRYDQFVDAYVVRYRISNLGPVATDKPLLLRLLVGGRGQLQIMQDIRIDKLTPGQSLNFEWTGDARAYPGLYDIVVRAQAKVVLDDQAVDANKDNNSRTVRLAY